MTKFKISQIVLLLIVSISLFSCSKEAATNEPTAATSAQLNAKYNYSQDETDVLTLINNYRKDKGLVTLEKVDFMSIKAEEHDTYMISVGTANHDYFQDRYEALVTNLGAKTVGENVAYNYTTPQGVFNAWLNSAGHRANIEGDYTHFGISIRTNADGKKYYTNLFMKK